MLKKAARRRAKKSQPASPALPAVDTELIRHAEKLAAQTIGRKIPIHAVTLDENADPATIVSRADHPLCRAICQTAEGLARCRACYRENFAPPRRHADPRVFVCHAGLAAVALPSANSRPNGGLVVGRAFTAPPSSAQRKKLVSQLRELDGNLGAEKLVRSVPVITERDLLLAALIVRNRAAVEAESQPRQQPSPPKRKPATAVAQPSPRLLRHQRICQQVAEIVEENFAQPLTVAQIATRVNLTPNYLCSLFHKTTRVTLGDHIARVRIQKAQQLLGQPQLHIKQVAFQVGFADPNHFAVVFKRLTGRTPTEWRARADAKILNENSSSGATQ
jgi:AraC-like DNA-binding protein/ligand-binding sensor protein